MSSSKDVVRAFRQQPKFFGLLFATTALGMAWSFVMPYIAIWGTRVVGFSSLQFSWFMTAAATSAVVVSTVFARWSDAHLSRRTTLLLGAAGGALGYTGYAITTNPVALVLIAITLVALSSVCFPQLFAHVRELFDRPENRTEHSGLFMSVVRVSFAVAWTVGPAVAAWVTLHFGFSGMFFSAGGLFGLFLIGVLLFVPHRAPTPSVQVKLPILRVLARGDIFAAFIAFALVLAAHAMNMMNLPLVIIGALGGTEKDVGIAFCVGPIVEIPLMLWFGHLSTKGHTHTLIRWGAGVTVVYFIVLSLANAPWQIYPIQVLSGASFAILTNVAILYFQDLLPGQTGLGTAIFSNSGNVGNLLGYFCFGFLAESVGNRGVFVVCAIMSAITLGILLGFRSRTTNPAISNAEPDTPGAA